MLFVIHTDVLWIKLDHRDIFLAIVYISPENSSRKADDLESIYAHILEGIVKNSQYGDIMIQGDFNAYTNTQHDFVLNDNSDHSVVNDVYLRIECLLLSVY